MQPPIKKKIITHIVFINVTKSQNDSNNEFITVTLHEKIEHKLDRVILLFMQMLHTIDTI